MKGTVSRGHNAVSGERRLTPQQQQFVDAILGGATPAQAAKAAGYGMGEGRSYTPNKAASVLLRKPHVKRALSRASVAQAVVGEQISEQWLRDRLIAAAVHGAKQSQMESLSLLCRHFFKGGADAADTADDSESKPLSLDEIRARIRRLEQELHGGSSEVVAPAKAPDSAKQQSQVASVPVPPQAAPVSHPAPQAQAPPLNMPPPGLNEQWMECPQHGQYLATRRGRPPSWSFCAKCSAEAAKYERWLSNLSPVGRGM